MRIHDARPWPDRALAALDAEPEGALARGLAPMGALWALAARFKRVLTPDQPLPPGIPTLGVGNLRVGGSGKTPVVEDLGRRLAAEGHRVAVLTRGYRAEGGADEPGWLEGAGLTVFADADRRRGHDRAVAGGATRILLDDALQTRHRPRWTVALVLDRDLARAPRPLPAGPARESAAALARADGIFVRREGEGIPVPEGALGFRLSPRGFVDAAHAGCAAPDGPGMLLSGLARPESFEADARRMGLDVVASWREADHWNPKPDAAERIRSFARQCGASWVLVPEKNLARAAGLGLPVFAIRSRIVWDEGTDPLAWLRALGIAM